MPLQNSPDQKRFYTELALNYGRSLQKKETGFVHSPNGTTISYFDNLCFVLTLLKTKSVDNILEAKTLLEKLKAFDSFPVRLHEHPICRDHNHPIRLLVPLLLIDRYFADHIDVKEMIVKLWEKAQLSHDSLLKRAIAHLLDGQERPAYEKVSDATLAAELLEEEWGYEAWNTHLGIAPEHAAISLYDFAMALKENSYPKRLLAPQPLHLQLSLLTPRVLREKTSPTMACFLKDEFTLFYGSKDHLCTMNSCSHGSFDNFRFTYPEELPEESKEVELALFWTYDRNSFPLFNGKRASLCYLDDTISFVSGEKQFTLSFHLVEGEGDFTVHLSRKDHEMWQLSLRTLRRGVKVVIECRIDIRQIEGEPCTCQFFGSGNTAAQEKLVGSLAN